MVRSAMLYLDDSGTRHPDRIGQVEERRYDWFALGGVIVNDEDYAQARDLIEKFRSRWPEMGSTPLHSWEIRNSAKDFTWLETKKDAFLGDLQSALLALPVIGIACVIDRKGYNARYQERYGN